MKQIENKLYYGGDYYPEQWLDNPEILKQDIEFMKKAKINVISIGVFAWSVLEPEEGNYQFEWLKTIINNLYKNGISVMLATPSGARPKWLSDKYQEVLRVNENRRRHLFGERHNHCYTSPVYREKVKLINQKLAENFLDNPAVMMWHISNEYGGECHCPLCQQEFRKWLQEKYETIEKSNKAWCTTFWSHVYRSFDEIESPSSLGEKSVHGLNLDWKRFVTDKTTDFMCHEINVLKQAGAKQPVTTNLMYDFQGLNYGKLAKHIDVVSWDSYPVWHKRNDIFTAMDNGMQHDYMRSLKHKPFLMMETCPSATNWQGVSKLKKPGLLMNASLQAIAHGSDSIQYFQIRQSRGSFEKFHGAVIDHYGKEDTRVFKEVSEVGAAMEILSEIAGTTVKAQAAVIYDVENRWAMEDAKGPRNDGMYYHESALKSYQALKKYGLDVDVIDMEQSLEKYKVVIAPMLYMFRAGIEQKIQKFVEEGGVLIMSYWSGVVDENDLCHLGGTPHKLMEVLGLRSEEIDGLYDGEENRLLPMENNSLNIQNSYTCKNLCELVKVEKAETLMVYESDFYKGKAAFTVNNYGKGKAYYVCADMEELFYEEIYEKVLNQMELEKIIEIIPEGIEINCRESDTNKYIFIQNYKQEAVKLKLPKEGKIIFGKYEEELKGLSTLVIELMI